VFHRLVTPLVGLAQPSTVSGRIGLVLIVRATKKLRQRLGSATPYDGEPSTTLLGEWYATMLSWRPHQLILLVNEQTLLPVLMPLAPGASGLEIAATLTGTPTPAEA
jgi:hypothetical protein